MAATVPVVITGAKPGKSVVKGELPAKSFWCWRRSKPAKDREPKKIEIPIEIYVHEPCKTSDVEMPVAAGTQANTAKPW